MSGRKPSKQVPAGNYFEVSGAIKWFDASKGYGFIVPDNGLDTVLMSLWDIARTQLATGNVATIEAKALTRAWGTRFSADEISALVVPRRTLARRIANKEILSQEETDRAMRLARISADADRIFGDPARAGRWLRDPAPSLGNRRPIDLLTSEVGAAAVSELLIQIDHGIFA